MPMQGSYQLQCNATHSASRTPVGRHIARPNPHRLLDPDGPPPSAHCAPRTRLAFAFLPLPAAESPAPSPAPSNTSSTTYSTDNSCWFPLRHARTRALTPAARMPLASRPAHAMRHCRHATVVAANAGSASNSNSDPGANSSASVGAGARAGGGKQRTRPGWERCTPDDSLAFARQWVPTPPGVANSRLTGCAVGIRMPARHDSRSGLGRVGARRLGGTASAPPCGDLGA
ncbi:hypothetical protein B0H11DRAFT_2262051 [Mycena galericulata]|nr:hypothetical protein B0H11DRAFT_2262051 [Mycena galericulata]